MNSTSTTDIIRIVLAEDQTILLDGLVEILKQEANFNVVGTAQNGKQALALVAKHKPNLAVLDIEMPVMSGTEAAQQIKKEFPETKILILSMHDDKAYVKELMQIGVDGYIIKERGKRELVEAINALMKGRDFFSHKVSGVLKELIQDKGKKTPKTPLTKREVEVLVLVAQDYTAAEVAKELGIGEVTINTHKRNIRDKLGLKGPASFYKYAIEHGHMDMG